MMSAATGSMIRTMSVLSCACCVAACILAFLASVLAEVHGFAVELIFGFYGVFGFVAIVVLITIAKAMRRVLMRDETYYDDDRY